MVQGIAEIVGKYFLNVELVRPHVDGIHLVHADGDALLLRHDGRRGQNAVDEGNDVKPLHDHLLIAEFQLVQGEKLLHHPVHFSGLIHDDLAVKLPALFIVVDTLLQALRITLDEGDGGFKLVGHVREEFFSHLVYLCLLLDVPLQLIVGRFQFRDGLLQLLRHLIDVVAEDADLVFLFSLIPGFKIQFRHFPGNTCQLQDRLGDPLGNKGNDHNAYQHHCHADIAQEPVGYSHALPDALDGASQDKNIAVVQAAPQLQIVIFQETVSHPAQCVSIRGFQRLPILGTGAVNIFQQTGAQNIAFIHRRNDGVIALIQHENGHISLCQRILQCHLKIVRVHDILVASRIHQIIGRHQRLSFFLHVIFSK